MSADIELKPLMEVASNELKIEIETPETKSMHTSDDEHELEHQFLVSFMVDAQGGTMRGCRSSGVRILIPPGKASMPTRITCQYLKNNKHIPNPINEGEIMVSKILKLGPAGAQFLG